MKITEHEMLITLANMALKMDDLTGADILDTLRQLGYGDVIEGARKPQPVSAVPFGDSVRWFAKRMEERLWRLNESNLDWSKCPFSYLDEQLDDEVAGLKHVHSKRPTSRFSKYERMIDAAVDVANFAMLIADKARRKTEAA